MISMPRNLWARRELLWVLILKEFSSRYRQSFLGVLWAVIQPLGVTFLGVVLRVIFARSGQLSEDVVFMFAATLPWTFFANAVIMGTASVVRNGSVLKKIYFPREIFVLAAVLTSLVDFLIAGVGMIALMIWAGVMPTASLLYVPLLLIVALALAFGIGLFTSAVAVYKRDIIYGMPFVMMFWMFLSPVFYGLADVPAQWRRLYMLNPMAGVIAAFRQVLIEGGHPPLQPMLYAVIVSFAVVVLCYAVFKKLEMRFADVI